MRLAERRAACVLLSNAGLVYVGQSFPSCRRIKKRLDFEQVLRTAALSNKWFSVYIRKNEYGFARLGVIASKRIMPTAIARNFAKRMIREGFRCSVNVDYAVDVVVRAKREIKPHTTEERSALVDLLQSLHK